MKSGIYLATLYNDEPISVNANDRRVADRAIKVHKRNCKVGIDYIYIRCLFEW